MICIRPGWVVLASACVVQGAWGQEKEQAGPIVADGARFDGPAGWTRLVADRPKTKGWFLSPDSTRAELKRSILVDIGKPTTTDARATALGLAKTWKGRVLEGATTLDGVEAFHVRVDDKDRGGGLAPVEAIVAHRGGKAYLIMGGCIPGASVTGEVEAVRKGWRWVVEE